MLSEGGITHNILIIPSISDHLSYHLPRGVAHPDKFQILQANGMGMIRDVFPQYNVGMGIRLDLDKGGTAASDPLAFDLPFPRRLLLVWLETACSVPCATEDLIGRVQGSPALDLRWP